MNQIQNPPAPITWSASSTIAGHAGANWRTLAVIADSGRAMYETMVRPLGAAEREALWQDYVRFGELFGLPREAVPATYREFNAWWEAKLASPDLHATEHALEMAPLVALFERIREHRAGRARP